MQKIKYYYVFKVSRRYLSAKLHIESAIRHPRCVFNTEV
jgi:hypothetical protein